MFNPNLVIYPLCGGVLPFLSHPMREFNVQPCGNAFEAHCQMKREAQRDSSFLIEYMLLKDHHHHQHDWGGGGVNMCVCIHAHMPTHKAL